jgi:hypothetical protein
MYIKPKYSYYFLFETINLSDHFLPFLVFIQAETSLPLNDLGPLFEPIGE